MKLAPCYVLLARDRATSRVTPVRVYMDRDAAEAALRILDWCRDDAREFQLQESFIEKPEPTA